MVIPLLDRNGAVRAEAVVDENDFESLSAWSWRLASDGYAVRFERRGGRSARLRAVLMHRVILGLEPGDARQADHIDRNRLNNSRANLRAVTRAQNMRNRGAFKNATSSHVGVSRHGTHWQASLKVDGVRHYLGYFARERDAVAAVAEFKAERGEL